MKDEDYLRACLKDYTKLGDEIFHLKKQNAALQEKLEQQETIIRGLRRKAKIDEESHEHQLNLATLQAAIRYGGRGGKKEEVERLQALVAGRQADGPLPRPPNSNFGLLFEEGEERVPSSSPPTRRSNIEVGVGLPSSSPSTGPIRPTHQQGVRGGESVTEGLAHRHDSGGRRPAQPPSGPHRQQGQEYQQYQQQQRQNRQKQRYPQSPHVDLCLTFLKSGNCPGCPRSHDPKDYPTWTKGYQVGLGRREERDHTSRSEFGGSAGRETGTTSHMGTGATGAGQKRTRSNFGAWSASKHRRFEEPQEDGQEQERGGG
ncbi:hypothetical protein TWF506_000050 [Arthrobotrys conoides]|uniref:Uncharacterized protein n=1 Tax=Arthrobotrys conoides TaxID=74498 RepID=A0AAN8RX92_9PEZI